MPHFSQQGCASSQCHSFGDHLQTTTRFMEPHWPLKHSRPSDCFPIKIRWCLCAPLVMGRPLSFFVTSLFDYGEDLAKYSWVTSNLLFSHLNLLCARIKGKSYHVQFDMLSWCFFWVTGPARLGSWFLGSDLRHLHPLFFHCFWTLVQICPSVWLSPSCLCAFFTLIFPRYSACLFPKRRQGFCLLSIVLRQQLSDNRCRTFFME